MENSDDAPRLLVQDGRFVKMFCAVLRTVFKTILPFLNPIRPHPYWVYANYRVRNMSYNIKRLIHAPRKSTYGYTITS